MEVPPIYSPTPQKSKTGLIIGLVFGGIVLCCLLPVGLLVGGGLFAFKKGTDLVACSLTFNNLQRSFQRYADDHHGKLPKSDKWMNDIRPIYRNISEELRQPDSPFKIPTQDSGPFFCSTDGKLTGIAFNKVLSEKKLDDIKDKETTVMIFETEAPADNLAEKYVSRPVNLSPKLFGKPRGWFMAPVRGMAKAGMTTIDTSGASIHVSTDTSTGTGAETDKRNSEKKGGD